MDLTSDFLRGFQPVLDTVRLPEPIADGYVLESCLSEAPQSATWLVRRRTDNERLVLRAGTGRELREEYGTMRRLPADLAGRVPEPVCFIEEGGIQYLIRTYLPGRSLAEAWEHGAASMDRCAAIGIELCTLLDRLHHLSPPVIHRDVKPENIILSPEGKPCLIDFGIARSYDPERDTDTIHTGTRATAAPEQYGFTQSDQRTDLYALGVTLRWMMTGSYQPEDLEASDCPARMKRVLRRAAAFDPARRYPSAAAMSGALRRVGKRPRRSILTAAAACLAAALLVLGIFLAGGSRPVSFDSAVLEAAVRAELGRPEGAIRRSDLKNIRRLAAVGRELLGPEQDYQYRLCAYVDGENAEGMGTGDASDLSLLADMPNLTVLYLCGQQVTDLTALAGLPLRELYLCDNQISDLAPLAGIQTLETLYIAGNPWTSLRPLSGLENLRKLNLDSWEPGKSTDTLEPLSGLELEFLSIGHIEPAGRDYAPLAELERLDTLWLWDPPDEAAAALAACGNLRALHLGSYRGGDLTGLPAIPHLAELSLYSRVPSLEGVQKQTELTALSLCGLPDIDLEPAAELSKLRYLWIYDCPISDFSPLAGHPGLREVNLQERNMAAMESTCPERGFEIFVS